MDTFFNDSRLKNKSTFFLNLKVFFGLVLIFFYFFADLLNFDSEPTEGMNLFYLPNFYESELDAKSQHFCESYDVLYRKLQQIILSSKKNSFAKVITEREWYGIDNNVISSIF